MMPREGRRRCGSRPIDRSRRRQRRGAETHHIVELDAVLEAEMVEFLIGCVCGGCDGGGQREIGRGVCVSEGRGA